jgi:hypothetical protein
MSLWARTGPGSGSTTHLPLGCRSPRGHGHSWSGVGSTTRSRHRYEVHGVSGWSSTRRTREPIGCGASGSPTRLTARRVAGRVAKRRARPVPPLAVMPRPPGSGAQPLLIAPPPPELLHEPWPARPTPERSPVASVRRRGDGLEPGDGSAVAGQEHADSGRATTTSPLFDALERRSHPRGHPASLTKSRCESPHKHSPVLGAHSGPHTFSCQSSIGS